MISIAFKVVRFLTILLLVSVVSCKKDSGGTIEITVLSADNVPLSGVGLYVIEEDPGNRTPASNSLKTSSKGTVKAPISADVNYVVYLARDGSFGNFFIDNSETTCLASGTFGSQQEINASPRQTPPAQVGDVRCIDFDGDGAINNLDFVLPVGYVSDGGIINVTLTLKSR